MIPRLCYPDLVPDDIKIQTRERLKSVDGNVSDFELDIINRLVKYTEPLAIFEIGTFDGRTTLNMASHAPPGASVFTLDLPPSEVDDTALGIEFGDRLYIEKAASGSRFSRSDMASRIEQLYGDSATFDFGRFEQKIDFLFVDGAHSYEYVLKDSETAMRLVRPGGVILWHDYLPAGPTAWPGVTKALEELQTRDPRFGTLRHIAGTTIVIMQVPGESADRPAKRLVQPGAFADSRQPECLIADLGVMLSPTTVRAGSPIVFRAFAINTGRAIWLPSGAPVGPVRLGSRLIDPQGHCLDASYSRHFFPGSESVSKGMGVSLDGELVCPPVGTYLLEFDLVSEGVVWFDRNGSKTVRIPIEVI